MPSPVMSKLREGLEATHWPGRCQRITLPAHPLSVVLDGAHTPESMLAFVGYLRDHPPANDPYDQAHGVDRRHDGQPDAVVLLLHLAAG